MDPSASNYNPNASEDDGTCNYIPAEGVPLSEGLKGYISQSLGNLWGNNFEGGSSEPNWEGTGFNYSGVIVSQRDITRLVSAWLCQMPQLVHILFPCGQSSLQSGCPHIMAPNGYFAV